MPEFSKSLDLPPVKLARKDIEQLGHVICDGVVMRSNSHGEYSFSSGDVTYQSSSIDGLMKQDLPEIIDSLSFCVWGRIDPEITQIVRVDVRRWGASCQIHSSDEIWFKGKIQLIKEFFAKRRPWYGRIKHELIGSILVGLALFSIVWMVEFFKEGWFLPATIAMSVVMALSVAIYAFFKDRLFPKANIQFCQKQSFLSPEVLTVIFTGVMAFASVATAIMQIV